MTPRTSDHGPPRGGPTPGSLVGIGVVLAIAAAATLAVWRALTAEPAAGPAQAAGSTAVESEAGFPRAVELPGGGTLRIEAPPGRIVPATARAVDLVAALVDPSRIAGAPEQAFEYVTEVVSDAGLEERPRFDAYVAETVLALSPDLVVTDPWSSADTHARLEGAGVAVLVLPEVDDWAGTRDVIELLGRVLGEETAATELVRSVDARVAALEQQAATRPRLGAVTYSNFGAQGFTAGSGTTLHEAMRLAGLVNLAAEDGRSGHVSMTFEDLLRLDPDVILVSRPIGGESGPSGDRGGAAEAVLRGEPSLARLRAVREDRILSLPAGLYASVSHGIVRAAEVLAEEVDRLVARLEQDGAGR